VGLSPICLCPYKLGTFGHRDRHTGMENDVKTQEEHQLQAKEHLRPLEATREAQNRLSLRALRSKPPLTHLNFRCLASRTVSQYISVGQIAMFVVLCYGKSGKLIQCLKGDNPHRES